MPCLIFLCRCSLPCLAFCLMFLHTSKGPAQNWREVQSPHFRVVTDGSEREGRDVAKEFEQMRGVFASRFNNPALDTGAPLLIFAVRERNLRALAPALWKDRDRVAGEFFRGWERQYAMVRLDSFGDLNQAVVFHEYAHSILHANVHWLPTWLDEGMAEFYAYTRFQGDRILVGAPSVRLNHVKSAPLIPIPKMLVANEQTYGKDARSGDLFYGEAWLMVHYLTFGPDMGGGAKLNKFIALLEKATPQAEAFQQVFGDPGVLERNLQVYVSRFTLTAGVLPPDTPIDTKSFTAKVLTEAEADYLLGSFNVGVHDFTEAATRLRVAESSNPALAGPHEELGFLAWRDGKDDEARTEWQKAVAADPASFRSAFALLMTDTPIKQQTDQQLTVTQQALENIREKAPKFAPALVELALIQWRLKHFNQAYKYSAIAEKLEPWRAGYHILSGYILLQGNQARIAEGNARMVAGRWPGADHDEAVDLWTLVPADVRTEPALKLATPADTTLVRGTIVSSHCEKSGFALVVQPATPDTTPLKLVAAGRFESGFSDTLWFGEDHYTPCFHLAGLPAVVAYKPDGTAPGKLVELEVRDDLPPVVLPVKALKTAEEQEPAE